MQAVPHHMCDNEDESYATEVKEINTITTVPVADEVDMWASEVLAKAQREDLQLEEFYKLKEEFGNKRPELEQIVGKDETCKTLWNQWDRIYLQDEVLYQTPWQINEHEEPGEQIIVPMKLRSSLLEMVHTGMTGGHLGFEKTKEQVRRRAYWPGYSKDVLRFCRECEACSRYKRGPAPKQGPLEPLVTGNVMERLSIDITGPHPISSAGHKFLLTVVDHFSKWAEAFPIRNQEASTIAKLLVDRVFCYFGMPIQILTDQGKNFESDLFSELCRCLDVEKIRTTIYKPSTNGVVERFHRTLNSMIGKIIHDNHRNWHELIPQILAAYRASEHSATGYSPNKLMLGRECRAPIDLVLGTLGDSNINISYNEYVKQMQERMLYCYESVRSHLSVAAERRKRSYDMSVRPKQFQVGQKVLYYYPRRYRFRSPKWQKMYIGHYEVVKQLGPLNYVIKRCNGRQEILAHIDKMKPYLGHLYDPQEDRLYHDTPDNNDIGSPNTDTLNERLGTVDNPPTINLSPRPARSRKPPEKYKDFVLFHVFEPNGHQITMIYRLARPAPTPRRCKFCEEVLNGKRARRFTSNQFTETSSR